MNKKSFASTIIAVIFVCPVLAVTHTFTPTDIGSLKIKMSDGSLQPGDTLLLQDGTYSHLGKVSFTGNGTADYPIILKAANTGKAIISGTTEILWAITRSTSVFRIGSPISLSKAWYINEMKSVSFFLIYLVSLSLPTL